MAKLSRCSNCTGELIFKPETGTLICERCGSSFPVNEGDTRPIIRAYSPTYVPEENKNISEEYSCTTCGAKIVSGSNETIRRCASCGNSTLKREKISTIAPDGIIPFTVSRKQAVQIFKNWVSSRKFAPSDLKRMAKLEKISGLYTPIWNFNFTATCRYNAIGVKKYTDSDGNEEFRDYPINKVKDQQYQNKIISASSRISDNFIEGLGTYDFNKLRPYSTDYLLGFVGVDTDLDIHSIYNNMTGKIASSNERKALNNLEADYYRVDNFNCRTRFRNVTFNYSYVPVWANHYTYKGKEYHCYINGQTGTATGKAPKSFLKITGLVLGILAGIGIIGAIIYSLLF